MTHFKISYRNELRSITKLAYYHKWFSLKFAWYSGWKTFVRVLRWKENERLSLLHIWFLRDTLVLLILLGILSEIKVNFSSSRVLLSPRLIRPNALLVGPSPSTGLDFNREFKFRVFRYQLQLANLPGAWCSSMVCGRLTDERKSECRSVRIWNMY